MNATLTVVSGSETLARLVGDFGRGLGCGVHPVDGGIRLELADAGDILVELLDFVALTAIRAGVDLNEPLCHLRYRRGGPVQVTLGLRCVDLTLDR